jgi:hypothetical protein
MDLQTDFDKAIQQISEGINKKRRQEVIDIYNSKDAFKVINDAKKYGTYDHGNKSKSMRKIAWVPLEVDRFFSKIYGEEYWKDKEFFNKIAPEWRVIERHKL